MDNFEKNYERAVDKTVNTVEKVGGAVNRLQLGCWIILSNLFFMGFCLWGAYAGYTSWKLDTEGKTAIGTVVRLEESSDSDGGCCVYSPVVEFTANDQTYSFESGNASYPPAYEVGEEVNVIYDPADPNTAQINKWTERWLFPIIIIPVMIFTSLIVTFILVRGFWRNDPHLIE
ncbi:MAG: DUF3592 domain-containing protein [Anaerolineales bacterium]|nr:DUF3592 domain-containing protein [Anaerolineales bacterium]